MKGFRHSRSNSGENSELPHADHLCSHEFSTWKTVSDFHRSSEILCIFLSYNCENKIKTQTKLFFYVTLFLFFFTSEIHSKNNMSIPLSATVCAIVTSWWHSIYWKWQLDGWQGKPFNPCFLYHSKFHIWCQRTFDSHKQSHMPYEAFRFLKIQWRSLCYCKKYYALLDG